MFTINKMLKMVEKMRNWSKLQSKLLLVQQAVNRAFLTVCPLKDIFC